MRKLFIFLPLLLFATGFALDPPSIVWTKKFFTDSYGKFYDVHETYDAGFIVAGWHLLPGGTAASISLYRFSSDGDTLWTTGAEGYREGQAGFWVEELDDTSLITTGSCGLLGEPTSAVMLLKTDSEGNQIWTTAFDHSVTNDRGNCVVPLEDGFAIAGNQGDKAWIIRTDLQGDSLWSATYQGLHHLSTRRILQVDNTLIVFYTGMDVGILAYSIDDGQLLWVADTYPGSFGSVYHDLGDLTRSARDGGFTFITSFMVKIAKTDVSGDLEWYNDVPHSPTSWSFGHSINTTIDGGYIYGGYDDYYDPCSNEPDRAFWLGKIFKFDSQGNEVWCDYVYECNKVYSVRQLSTGGYIACGGHSTGTLLRYEPETGIEAGEDVSASLITALTPNPFSSTLNIGYHLAEASTVELSVFDLSGRLIAEIEKGFFPAGEHSSVWIPQEISSGCYLVGLSTPEGCYVKNCVFIP